LVLYYLIFLLAAAVGLSVLGILKYDVFALLFSIAFLIAVCWVVNWIFCQDLQSRSQRRVGLYFGAHPGFDHHPAPILPRSLVSGLGGGTGDGFKIHPGNQPQAHFQPGGFGSRFDLFHA